MTDHATFSASSAERWINCPGSIHMAGLFPATSSPAAEEGTLAHELAAAMLEGARREALAAIEEKVSRFYGEHPDLKDSFTNMARTIGPYIDFVNDEYQQALAADPAAVLLTEQRVDFSDVVPGGFGTSDVVIIGGGRATVIDLKYGKGVPVSAQDNPQIRLYAVGAVNAFDLVYDFDRVKMVIYQPRLDSVTVDELTVEELKAWAESVVKPAAEKAVRTFP